jgi:NAD(P)-dependent dehydrogenase (short-subunit alcohol dehydrogenase family)
MNLQTLMDGKAAVVTSSAVGIGRGISIALAEHGANVTCLDIDVVNNHQTAELVREAGAECLAIDCDVADKVQVRHAINEAVQTFGRIDVLINNAGVWEDSSLLTGTYESQTDAYDRAMGACAMGAYYCTRAAVPQMLEVGGGNVLNVITEHIKEGHYLSGPALGYDSAKFSMWRQVETWATELAEENIRVNGLCFGATDTPMLRGVAPEIADAAIKVEDLGQAVINVLAHGPRGPTGQTYLFETSGTLREESLAAIAALGFQPRTTTREQDNDHDPPKQRRRESATPPQTSS